VVVVVVKVHQMMAYTLLGSVKDYNQTLQVAGWVTMVVVESLIMVVGVVEQDLLEQMAILQLVAQEQNHLS